MTALAAPSTSATSSGIVLCLVACSKTKARTRRQARDLYTSQLFRLAKSWAELNADQWAILSGFHGVVSPFEQLDPYDWTMADHRSPIGALAPDEHDGWIAGTVGRWLHPFRSQFRCRLVTLVVLAGREYLRPVRLACPSIRIEDPMCGLQIGERLSWLKREVETGLERAWAERDGRSAAAAAGGVL